MHRKFKEIIIFKRLQKKSTQFTLLKRVINPTLF